MEVKNDVVTLLRRALDNGIRVFLEDQKLKMEVAKDRKVDPAIIDLLRRNKEEIRVFLSDGMGDVEDMRNLGQAITPYDRDEHTRLPLSFSQEQLWFIDQLEGSVQYHQTFALRLRNELDQAALEKALRDLLDRHEVLRTVIHSEAGTPFQQVLPAGGWQMDYSEGAAFEEEGYLDEFIAREFRRPFDLSGDYMLRAHLVRIGEGDHVLILVMHHIASDGWSKSIMVNDLMEFYSARLENRSPRLPELPIQYADYAIWQRSHLSGEFLESRLQWWEEQLRDLETLKLPLDFPRPPVQSTRGDRATLRIGKELAGALKELSSEAGTTLFMTLLTAFKVMLHRYSGQEDICIGTPLANRGREEVEPLVGFFVNSLVLRSDLSGNPGFTTLLERVKTAALSAFAHQEMPLELIVRRVEPERRLDRNPLFQVMFVLHNTPEVPSLELGALNLAPVQTGHLSAKFDLVFSITENPEGLFVEVIYCRDLFRPETIDRLTRHFNQMLESVVAAPQERISRLPVATDEERQQITGTFNDTKFSYPKEKRLIELFQEQALQTPEKAALLFGGEPVTYRELDERSSQMAQCLLAKGVKTGDRVGIMARRGFDMIINLLGVLKCGAIYVPLNLEYPAQRIRYIMEDAAVSHLICSEPEMAEEIGVEGTQTVFSQEAASFPTDCPPPSGRLSDGAYVMYTSGTTGRPKGILVSQQNILKLVCEPTAITVSPADRVLQWSNFAFDGSTYDIYSALLKGATLCLIREEEAADVERLAAVLKENQLTVWFVTTALFNSMVDYDPQSLQGLRRLLFGGERVSVSHVRKAFEVLGPGRLVHVYGPTETTVYATSYLIESMESGRVPIGRPLSNTTAYVVDEAGQPVGIGMTGELYIGGHGVSSGYLNRPELTARQFIDDPFSVKPGSKLYRTGDLVTLLPDGNIEFVGRKDSQLKMRGYRVEIGEIESILRQSPHVGQGVVVAREDVAGTKQLVAYVVPASPGPEENGRGLEKSSLKAFLKSRLPDYMVPSLIVPLEKIPLNANGKLDKKALPAPEGTLPDESAYVAPRTDTERSLAGIWSELLQLESIGVRDNFFEIGGHSLLAIRVIAAVRRQLDRELSVRDVFTFTTIESLAAHLDLLDRPAELPPITAEPRPDHVPLSYSQERLWFIDQLEGSAHYHIPQLLRLEGELDEDALANAFGELVNRHEVLRTVYRTEKGIAVQKILPPDKWSPAIMDWSEGEKDISWQDWVRQTVQTPFDLANDHMLRVFLVRKEPRARHLLIVLHHIAADGWSLPILVEELFELYRAFTEDRVPDLQPLPIQYADYAIWQRRYLGPEQLEGRLTYWEEKLKGGPPLQLPLDFPRPPVRSTRGAVVSHHIPRPVHQALTGLCREEDVTLFMVLVGALKVLLYRYSGQTDLCVGTSVANRTRQETDGLIGFFINALALRSDLSGQPAFRDFLQQVKSTSLDAFARQDVPFEQIVERVVRERDPSRTPLFEVMFVLQNTPDSGARTAPGGTGPEELRIVPEKTGSASSKFDLSITVTETQKGLAVNAIYSPDLFRETTITRMLTHYQYLLVQIGRQPGLPVHQLKLLSAQEEKALVEKFNSAPVHYDRPRTLLAQFETQMEKTPESPAVMLDESVLTYAQLETAANRWAHWLKQQGVQRGDIVGIALERSFDMIIAILAAFKAGATYLPIDPDYPAARIDYMLRDAGVRQVLTHTAHRSLFGEETDRPVASMDQEETLLTDQPATRPEGLLQPGDAAYVIYTSGSTGRPKGVIVNHDSVVNQGHWAQDFIQLTDKDVIMQKTTFCFDPSVWEFFWPLSVGGRVCFARPHLEGDSHYLIETIETQGVTSICLVPSMFSVFLQDVQPGQCAGLRWIICGGEPLQKSQLELCKEKLPQVQVYNMYGPTEAAIHVSCWPVPEDLSEVSVIPLGRPLSNVQIHMLDEDGQLVPEGVVGELCISGIQLARGYLNRPRLTHEKFVSNPYSREGFERLYRTGDLARWLPDGNIEYIGRKDNQLKINGFRVELGEVEYFLNQSPAVRSAAVLARKNTYGHNQLVAYIVPEGDFDKDRLEAHLRSVAPAYMVPSYWVPLEQMPIGSTGKIDRQALPAPDLTTAGAGAYLAPRNEVEEALVRIWKELLPLEEIGMRDDFFEIGGHSLLAMRVISAIREIFDKEIRVKDMFTYSTIEDLANYLQESGEGQALPPLTAGPRPEKPPLSYSQERLWFVDQLRGSTHFHQPTVLRLRNELDRTVLEQALRRLVERHEVLRTVFGDEDGQPFQVALSADDWEMEYVEDLGPADVDRLQPLIEEAVKRPFDLSADYMLRARLVKCSEEDHVLILVLHHIASDGWSESILVRDLMEYYRAGLEDRAPDLPPLPIQYADFATWQRRHLSGDYLEGQLKWWEEQLAGLETLSLPTDHPRPSRQSTRGDSFSFNLEKAKMDRLKALALASDATLFMTLLSVFKVLLYRYSGQEDICVGTSLANRNYKEVEPLAGFFVNNLVLRNNLGGNPTFQELLEQVKTGTLAALAHQEVPFEQIVDRVESRRDLSRNPVFQVLFTLHNTPEVASLELGTLEISGMPTGQQRTLYDLSFYLTETPAGLRVGIVYCSDLFDRETIERMAGHFHRLLLAAAEDPAQEIDQLPMLTEAEEQQLATGVFPAELAPEEKTVVDLFEEQVARTPDKIALVHAGEEWTYRMLNQKANRVAHHLHTNYDLRADDLVGVMMDVSPWAIAALLGILKTGAAYVPFDPDHPAARKQFMLEDTGVKALIVSSKNDYEAEGFAGRTMVIDRDFETWDSRFDEINVRRANNPENLVYVMYTSGSTGQSKGVMVTHRNLTNYLYGLLEKVDLHSCRSFGLLSTLAADLGNTVLYGSLVTGGALHLFSKKTLTDGNGLYDYFQAHPVDCIKIVPSHWRALETENGILLPKRTLIFGGETLSVEIIEKIRAANPALEVINHYGPTEATIGKVLHRVNLSDDYESVPIGRPFGGAKTYVVNQHMKLCPVGVPGELMLAGEGIARGYWNRPDLSREKFIWNPFGKDEKERAYRTGDLVRQLPDGNLAFLGRRDDQVKIRGYRVEMGEIENVLRSSDAVQSCAVLAKADAEGDLRLVAYVVSESAFDRSALQAFLGERLPDYMVPAIWMEMDRLPLTSNGKVDKKALPAPDTEPVSGQTFVAPRTDTEKVLANIWCKLLKLEKVGVHDHFFEIGGHSLLAIRVISAIRKELKQKPDLEDIFTYPTIESLARYLEGGEEETELPPITVEERPERIPLSFAQERLWFTDQLGGSVQYHMPAVLRLRSRLDRAVLEAALRDLVDRHEVLRTVFGAQDGEPYQRVIPPDGWTMAYSEDEAFADESYLREFIVSEINRPFDLSADYMLRAHLVKCAEKDHVLILVLHHIASDGWSNAILVKDLVAFYRARQEGVNPDLEPLPVQYADYAIWQRKHLSGERLANQLEWWEDQLRGLEPLELPTDFPRPAVQSNRGDSISFQIEKELTDQVKSLALDSDATLFMTLLSAFYVLLYRYSGQEDLCVGAPLANRDHKEVEPLVGCFLNALVLRSDLSGNPGFRDLLAQVKAKTLEAFKRQQVPFEQIVDRVEKDRSLSRSPIFQALFSMRNTPEIPDLTLGDLSLSSEPSGQRISQLDLAFYVKETPQGMQVVILYCSDLFRRTTIERMAGHYQQLLQGIIAGPDQALGALPLLTEPEEERLLETFNDLTADYPADKTIVDSFAAQAGQTPDAIAVSCEGRELTYRGLEEQSDQLAAYLKDTCDLKSGDLVGVMMKRSEWAIIAMLGIMKAGAAYVPIDTELPAERKDFIVSDTGIKTLIVHSENLYDVMMGGFTGLNVFAIDLQMNSLDTGEDKTFSHSVQPGDLAYVIYTSGSTGQPKGVQVEHRGIKNTILSQKEAFGVEAGDHCLQFYSLSFDASLLEIWNALLTGARLCIIGNEERSDPAALYRFLQENGVTVAAIPPAFLNELDIQELSGLKTLFTGGELATPEVIQTFLAHGNYCNSYGPTETSICATVFKAERGSTLDYPVIPIGRPIENVRVYILDSIGNLLPEGATGELCIGGAGVARGYLNNRELMEEKFVTDPFAEEEGAIMYKTGDLARWLPDGNIEFLGRKDDQVKIRGHRIELGEIENTLDTAESVKNCAVITREGPAGERRLVAYVVPSDDYDRSALQSFLIARLPDYMVPAVWVEMDSLPLTTTGKVDKEALPAPDTSRQSDQAYVAPRNEMEEVLAKTWAELLRVEKVGIHDNFFALGGHSLLAVRLLSAIKEAFALSIPLKAVFEFPTIAELQKYLKLMKGSENEEPDEESEVFEI